jgi:hypothetical protein
VIERDELRDLRDAIVEEMRLGFAGVHSRQDQTNGRVLKTEKEVAVIDERMRTVADNYKVIFRMLNARRKQRIESRPDEDELGAQYPQKYPNKVVVPGAMAAAVAASEALQRIIPAVLEALK